jgi:excisionase family DNA binding protein
MTDNPRAEAVGPRKAAALMDVSEATIIRLIRSGQLRATRMGRQWRILLSDLKRGTNPGEVDKSHNRRS